jgi:DNA-binding beta-propeller fold protein YncE
MIVVSPYRIRVLLTTVVVTALALLVAVPVASASFEEVGRFASLGSGEGELGSFAKGVAVNDASGEVYVADGWHRRVSRFNSHGSFLGAWGWGVVASGPDETESLDQTQEVEIRAAGGTFKVMFAGQQTGPLPFPATPSDVESALQGLSTVGGVGGTVVVSGVEVPGQEGEIERYYVVFGGTLGGVKTDPLLTVDSSALTRVKASVFTEVTAVAGFEDCVLANGDVCKTTESFGVAGEGSSQFVEPLGIAVDQTTGDVYVLDGHRRTGVVQVFSSDGKQLIASFGEMSHEPVAVEPEKIEGPLGIAVDASGDVYVVDDRFRGGDFGPEARVMVFDPVSGSEYKQYVYAGRSHDLATGYGPQSVAVDPPGDAVYVVAKYNFVYKFGVAVPAAPLCEVSYGTLWGLTVAPDSGNVFVYASQPKPTFYELNSSCEQLGSFPGVAHETETTGLAYDPNLVFGGHRPAGVLYAVNTGTPPALDSGLIFARPEAFPPVVVSESVGRVGSSSALLQAQVDPHGFDTTFRFQYGVEACSLGGCSEAPLGGGVVGTGQSAVSVSESVSGLLPGTTYHYRVLASNAFGTVEGVEGTFTTFPVVSPGLADGRVYELVSPVGTDGGEVFLPEPETDGTCSSCKPGSENEQMPMQSTAGGNMVVYEGDAFAMTGEAVNENEYLATRSQTGWQTRDLSPELESKDANVGGSGFKAFSTDLSVGVLSQAGPALAPEGLSGFQDLYSVDGSNGGLTPMLTVAPPDRSPGNSGNTLSLAFVAGSEDFSHLLFEANDALTAATVDAPAAVDGGVHENNLYERVGGGLRLVNVLPGNTVTVPGAVFGAAGYHGTDHAISNDGSRIFWSVNGHVYVRVNGEASFEIPDPGSYLTASGEGSKILLDNGHMYNLENLEHMTLTDLTGGHGGFQGIMGASEDLSHVYFVATSVLAANTNENGEAAEAGKLNLYAWARGSGGEEPSTVFIGRLSAQDNTTVSSAAPAGDWRPSASYRTAQVTPDGRYLAFMSQARLTGYDNEVQGTDCVDGSSAIGLTICFEVFEYDSSTGRLVCASCNPAGIRPLGNSYLSLIRPEHGSFAQPRNLSDDGRVFFDSLDVLSPQDTNGDIDDVYEYEPDGIGSCSRPGGCVSLISSGRETSDSNFIAADPSGDNVFFATRANLTGNAPNGLYRLFDARVNGGFPQVSTPACTGTGCQGLPGTPPIFATPSSVTFNGVGNFTTGGPASVSEAKQKTKSVKCARAKKLVHGRCVKQKKAKKAKRARKVSGGVRRRARS